MTRGLLPLYTSDTMIAAAPEGRPGGGSVTENKKNSFPAVPLRGPEAGSFV